MAAISPISIGRATNPAAPRGDRGSRPALVEVAEAEVEFALPETLYSQVTSGQVVRAAAAAFPGRVFKGRVVALDGRIDPDSRSFRSRAVIPNPDHVLPGGMVRSLDIMLDAAEAVVVPEEAVVFQAAEAYVFTVSDGVARRAPVVTGQRRGGGRRGRDHRDPGTGLRLRPRRRNASSPR